MAVLTKPDLESNIDSTITTNGAEEITGAELNAILKDIVDSYEDFIVSYTTVQRDVLTPAQGDKIFNTDNGRVEIYSGTKWKAAGTKETIILDCSSNPNYPESLIGDFIVVTVAGKIGGASGTTVYANDLVVCITANAGGTQASVGTSWKIIRSAGTAYNDVLLAEISLSSANLQALNGTPITAVAAPGAGKIIVPLNSVTKYLFNTTQYNAGAGPIVGVFDTLTAPAITFCPDLRNATADKVSMSGAPMASFDNAIENKALTIKSLTANYAGGDGTVSIKLYYKIVTL